VRDAGADWRQRADWASLLLRCCILILLLFLLYMAQRDWAHVVNNLYGPGGELPRTQLVPKLADFGALSGFIPAVLYPSWADVREARKATAHGPPICSQTWLRETIVLCKQQTPGLNFDEVSECIAVQASENTKSKRPCAPVYMEMLPEEEELEDDGEEQPLVEDEAAGGAEEQLLVENRAQNGREEPLLLEDIAKDREV